MYKRQHLAPFVDVSRQKIRKQVLAEIEALGVAPSEDKVTEIVEKRLREEIRRGVQTIQYQVCLLYTSSTSPARISAAEAASV